MSSMLPRSYLMIRKPGSSLLMKVAVDSSPDTTATVCTVSVSATQPSIPASSRTSQPPGASLSKTMTPLRVWPVRVSPVSMCLIWMVTPERASPVSLHFSTRREP